MTGSGIGNRSIRRNIRLHEGDDDGVCVGEGLHVAMYNGKSRSAVHVRERDIRATHNQRSMVSVLSSTRGYDNHLIPSSQSEPLYDNSIFYFHNFQHLNTIPHSSCVTAKPQSPSLHHLDHTSFSPSLPSNRELRDEPWVSALESM